MRTAVFVLLCMIWGSTWLAIKVSLQGLPPFLGAAARFSVAVLAVLAVVLIRRASLKVSLRELKLLSISAVLMYALDYGLIYWAEQFLTAGVTAIFFATCPLFTVVFANFALKNEKFSWRTFLGIATGFVGILVVFFDQLLLTRFSLTVLLASVAVVVAAAAAAMSTVLVKRYLSKMNRYSLTFHQLALGVVILSGLGFTINNPAQIEMSPRVYAAVLYLGLMGSALAFVLYYWLLEKTTAVTLSLIVYVTPIVAVALDFALFGEIVSPSACIGMALVFSGIWISQSPLARRPPLRAI